MTGPVVVACNRLHALAYSKHDHDKEACEGIHHSEGRDRHIPAVADELGVLESDDSRSGDIHQERAHAYHEDVLEYVEFRSPGMATESDEGLPVDEMQDGDNRGRGHGDGRGPGRAGDTPVEHKDEERIQDYVQHRSSGKDEHRFLRIAGSPDETGKVECDCCQEHSWENDQQILPGIGNRVCGRSEHRKDVIHEDIAESHEKGSEYDGQDHAVAENLLSPADILESKDDGHPRR